MAVKMYGIWNEAARAWVADDKGRPFRTSRPDEALDAYNALICSGACGIRVRLYPED